MVIFISVTAGALVGPASLSGQSDSGLSNHQMVVGNVKRRGHSCKGIGGWKRWGKVWKFCEHSLLKSG